MKLSPSTLSILKSFSRINSSILLKKGNFIMTRAIEGTVYAEATIEDNISEDIVIYDLNSFLSIMSLVGDNATIDMDSENKLIKIKNDSTLINFPSAELSTIVYPTKAIEFPIANVTFELKAEEYKQLTRIARSMKIDTLCIGSSNGNIVIEGFRKTIDPKFEKPLYQTVVGEFEGPEETEFKFYISMQNIDLIESDYRVCLFGKGSKVASRFEGEQASYVIALETSSTHNFG